ncbi:MAG: hypothetical protein P4L31_06590, partial [Candidatus Babeliales bacterium]|nr:hypothetical protein [Candidatus Babeliales bacterium]
RVFLAAYNNDSDELAAALINGGNIDAGDLVSLAYYAPAKKLDLLLKHGANPDAKDSVGYTASENAIESGNAPALAVLLKYGARLDNIGASKLTLEQLAKKYGRTHCLEAIEDARQLRLAKRNEELEAYKAALQKQSWQKILKDYRAPSQPASCHEAPAPASSSIDLEKAQQQKNELRKKQELENEHARVTARQEEAYMREYTKGQRLARKKKVQLKQTKHKK